MRGSRLRAILTALGKDRMMRGSFEACYLLTRQGAQGLGDRATRNCPPIAIRRRDGVRARRKGLTRSQLLVLDW